MITPYIFNVGSHFNQFINRICSVDKTFLSINAK